ncbi:PQQ-dependent sugar dehydrogenase [Rhabdothermincola salaria]|uniref:PQQ-dependent sugar dehydrogenase n=1 Tax=Rhabdothermincola salaria TaxID=2903142 RepID=UPI001E387DB8|nr:PQQ-dependent sugar dehydrogenase [Rhabdothermincola salaria]MCD9624774.1 PQQ-dependent sugar dehydrogenase [Rhabdothermincola salaria]
MRPPSRTSPSARARGLVAVVALLAAACSGADDGEGASTTTAVTTSSEGSDTTAPDPGPGPTEITTTITLAPVVDGLDQPTAMAPRPGHSDLWITEQGGAVRRVDSTAGTDPLSGQPGPTRYELDPEPVLDLGDLTEAGGEQGLLGIAFSSDAQRLYLHHTSPDGDVVVAEYRIEESPDGDPRVDAESRRVLLTIPHSEFPNHNGGQLATGPDGFLYVGVGDGGGAGDPLANGQDPGTLLGAISRIDPEAPGPDRPYAVPEANPFADGEGGAPEVYLYGARNPWRFSFDTATGDLWVADVGQNEIEEINWLPAADGAGLGANLGWDWFEGDRPYRDGDAPDGLVDPLFTYDHSGDNCSVTGGYVYRGEAIESLDGVYVFGDYCGGDVRGLLARNGVVLDERSLGAQVPGRALVSFGQDDDGELYVLAGTGELLKVVEG